MSPIRLAVADRHPVVRLGVRLLVSAAPDVTLVGEADDADAALRLARSAHPDVLLLGMNLPVEESLHVAEAVHGEGAGVSVLCFSAHEEERHLYEALARRVAGYLSKAELPEVLLDAVRQAASGTSGLISAGLVARLTRGVTPPPDLGEVLSSREWEVLGLVAEGLSNDRVAEALSVSPHTVKNHLTSILSALGLTTRAEAVAWAWRHGAVRAGARG